MKLLRNDKSGFTLIEVVIAMGILGFGILAMFSMQTFGIRGNRVANTVTQKVSWSASAFEKLLLDEFDDVAAMSTCPTIEGLDASLYTCTMNAPQNDTPVTGMMTISLSILSNVDNTTTTLNYIRTNENVL